VKKHAMDLVREGSRGGRARAALAAAVTSLAIAPGCGGSVPREGPAVNPEVGPVTIRFLRHDNPNYRKADAVFFAEYMAAHPEVTIMDTTVPFGTLTATLIGDLRRDQFAFDLVLIPPSRVCSFASNLTDVPADVITLADAQKALFTAPLAGSTCAGKLKGLPIEFNLEYGGVVVNVDKYQAKFPGKTPGWTDWKSFLAEAAALTEYDAGNPKANGLDLAPPKREIFLSQILQRGGRYWSAAGDRFNFSTPQAREALIDMVSWVTEHRVMFLSLIPDKNTHVTTRLASGATGYGWSDPARPLSVMGYLGTAGVPSTVAQLPPGAPWHYDHYPVPPMVGTEHRFAQDSGWAFAVPRTSANPKVAWDIARSLALSPEAMRRWSAVTGALPALRANATPGGDWPGSRLQPLLEHGQWMGYVPVGAIDTVAGAIQGNFFHVVAGRKDVDQALLDMQQTANAAIEMHQGD
jgi:multiple sugar transport system substrate-binding protein